MKMKGLKPDVVRTNGMCWHCGRRLHLLQLCGILKVRRTWLDSTKIQRRTGLHKDSEEDWTPQSPEGGLDFTNIQRRTGLHKDLEEDWTPQRSGGGLDSTKVWMRTGLYLLSSLWSPVLLQTFVDWTLQRSGGGLDSTKAWRRTLI